MRRDSNVGPLAYQHSILLTDLFFALLRLLAHEICSKGKYSDCEDFRIRIFNGNTCFDFLRNGVRARLCICIPSFAKIILCRKQKLH